MAPQDEITGQRPKNYSLWHRPPNLPGWCFMTDGDWFEQRKKGEEFKSVAYIETIKVKSVDNAHITYPVWRSKKSLILEIEKKMGIPAYVVWHNPDCTDFLVSRLSENIPTRMNAEEYVIFIKKL